MEYPSLDKPKAGAFRFNTDSSQLEIYDGNQWTGVLATSPEQQTGGTRTITCGGIISSRTNHMTYANVETAGDYAEYGDLTVTSSQNCALSSRTRGIHGWGTPSSTDGHGIIDYFTIASTGNAIDFGDPSETGYAGKGVSNGTRGVVLGRAVNPNTYNTIQYITIATTGNALDFGDLTYPSDSGNVAGNSTRGIALGGGTPTNNVKSCYINIATTGNAADFGTLVGDGAGNAQGGMMGSATKGCYAGTMTATTTIGAVTIHTLGSSKDFGDLTFSRTGMSQSGSTVRGVVAGNQEGNTNVSDFFQIATGGDAKDFGDLTNNYGYFTACTNGHGGL